MIEQERELSINADEKPGRCLEGRNIYYIEINLKNAEDELNFDGLEKYNDEQSIIKIWQCKKTWKQLKKNYSVKIIGKWNTLTAARNVLLNTCILKQNILYNVQTNIIKK